MKFDTLAVHCAPVDEATGAVAPPIHLATTFARDHAYALRGSYSYIREANPTQLAAEEALALLEGGARALVHASGMAAGVAVLQTLPPGSHVVLPEDVYYGVRVALRDHLVKQGITATHAAMEDVDAIRRAMRPETRVVWIETPSNPQMKVTDLDAAIAIAREAGALALVDNTFATPALQRPIDLGADVVLHASTKYFGGHSDVQGGVLVFREDGELAKKVEAVRHDLGAVASPFNTWLVMRGIRTLGLRVERHSANAMAIARALEGHPKVGAVHYPGLESHPGHAVAKRQMRAFGGMLSFRVRAGREDAVRVASSTKLFVPATSLGGVESLIEHRHTAEGPGSTAPEDLLRLSVGIEDPADLIDDLLAAL
ncbi:MAG TPA: aminotransferase class I/II-fold pyridoxal phosphate-dependent enzyme [Candidatus Polarisedimenticolaceae bacterium]